MARTSSASLVIALAFWTTNALASETSGISKEEYYGAAYYKQALEHPKIAKMKGDKQISAVAKDIKMNPKKLKSAIQKIEALGGEPGDLAVEAIKAKLEQDKRLKGKVLDVLINTEEPKHVVLYVRWQGSTAKDVVKEASTIANAVSAEAPFVSTLSLAAIHPKSPKSSRDPVWSAKIGDKQMSNIQPSRIDEYADRLYTRLFEVEENQTF